MTSETTIKDQGKEVEGQTSQADVSPKSGLEVQERAIEPTKIGQKREKRITEKQLKYVQLRQEHPDWSKRKCALTAGYRQSNASFQIEQSPTVKNRLTEALYRQGLTEDKLSIRLNEAVDAEIITNKEIKGADGRITRTEIRLPDHNIRLQALKFSTEILGYGREKEETTPSVVIHFHQRKEYEPVEAEVQGQGAGDKFTPPYGTGVSAHTPPTPGGR